MNFKSKLLFAFSSLTSSPSNTTSAISAAVRRATDPRDGPLDDDALHELLFLVSNSPSSSSFLVHRLSARLLHHPISTLKALLLLHRLLRGGHRRFELDIRDLHASGNLRLDVHHHSSPFLHYYSRFISERTAWAIDQSGGFEPIGPVPCRTNHPTGLPIWKLSRTQDFLDRVVDTNGGRRLTSFVRPENRVGWEAMTVVLKESFRVYESFADGFHLIVTSLANPTISNRILNSDVGALHQIIRRSSSQSIMLSEFYEACKRIIGCNSMDFPKVRITGEKEEKLLTGLLQQPLGTPEVTSAVGRRDKWKLETRISTEWVKF